MRNLGKPTLILAVVLLAALALAGGLLGTVMAAPLPDGTTDYVAVEDDLALMATLPNMAANKAQQDRSGALDLNYDDAWVANVPTHLDGFDVLFISTPKNRACSFIPNVTLRAAQRTVSEVLEQADGGAVLAHLRAIPGVPQDVVFNFAGPNASTEGILAYGAEWNAAKAKRGCETWADIEDNEVDVPRGYAAFLNLDANSYTDDNAQSVNITSPSQIGTAQNQFSAALNNVRTNGTGSNVALQDGMNLAEGNLFIGWTDIAHQLAVQPFDDVPYYASTTYLFSITYTSGMWYMCAQDNSHSNYQCQSSPSSTGTSLVFSYWTSVWFENANSNSNWYSGFPTSIVASGAQIYRNGTGQNWSSEHRLTYHRCGPVGTYPVSGAMGTTTLTNGWTAGWVMGSGMPINCN